MIEYNNIRIVKKVFFGDMFFYEVRVDFTELEMSKTRLAVVESKLDIDSYNEIKKEGRLIATFQLEEEASDYVVFLESE